MSWSRNWPNCITMWVNSFLPGFEPLFPGVLCIALDTSRGPTFTWAINVKLSFDQNAKLSGSCPKKLHQPGAGSASLLDFQAARNQDPPIASSQLQLLPNSHSSSCCTCRQFFELCRIFGSQLSHPCTLRPQLLLTGKTDESTFCHVKELTLSKAPLSS